MNLTCSAPRIPPCFGYYTFNFCNFRSVYLERSVLSLARTFLIYSMLIVRLTFKKSREDFACTLGDVNTLCFLAPSIILFSWLVLEWGLALWTAWTLGDSEEEKVAGTSSTSPFVTYWVVMKSMFLDRISFFLSVVWSSPSVFLA